MTETTTVNDADDGAVNGAVVGAAEAARPLSGRGLRFVLVDHLQRRGTMTVAEMVSVLGGDGYTMTGRASKVISDALRWEVAQGRVARGVYRYGKNPSPTTARRIRLFARTCNGWIVAVMRGQTPPPTAPSKPII